MHRRKRSNSPRRRTSSSAKEEKSSSLSQKRVNKSLPKDTIVTENHNNNNNDSRPIEKENLLEILHCIIAEARNDKDASHRLSKLIKYTPEEDDNIARFLKNYSEFLIGPYAYSKLIMIQSDWNELCCIDFIISLIRFYSPV